MQGAKTQSQSATIGLLIAPTPSQAPVLTVIKCDGRKPVCFRCADRKLPCTYRPEASVEASSGSKRKHEDDPNPSHDLQILELLKSVPSDAALEILRDLRGGAPISGILDTSATRGFPQLQS